MTKFKKIHAWNFGRGLLEKGFNKETEYKLLKEELDEFEEAKNDELTIDALCDIIVVATGAIYKLGYDVDIAMEETLKEINSRIGAINPATGKWEKRTDIVAKRRWYKAKYSKAKYAS